MPAWRAVRAGVVVGVTLAATLPALASAAPPGAQPETPELAAKAPTVDVTLVTGDTVTVGRLANGNYVAQPQAAPSRAAKSPVGFQTLRTPEGDLYVIPSDAGQAIAAGTLDRELFNVARLVEEGHTGSRGLPVIIQYGAGNAVGARASKQADALPATTGVRSLESIGAAGVELTTTERADFWSTLRGSATGTRTLSAGVERVWLDREVHALLDQSVRQVGAPVAWEAGLDGTGVSVAVLDTGVDAGHPDLAEQVVEARSFVPGESAQDGHGHGTHVASTIAGTGAASDGRYRGVAPGTDLLVGKVLDNSGFGQTSWIIDGMEWAADSGARAVSMSLGGDPTDGSDPLSQAVEALTARTGTLFVIAAGNDGPGKGTVSAPGVAPSALTVGAVDRDDQLAEFSSRGPVVRTYGLKPDLTAPGVGIVAARASGTSMGNPVDGRYTAASGTSMATPHVAGAVAILAQQHPDWRAGQLKAALTGSAVPNASLTSYEQGAGRLDIGRAIGQRLTASPSSVDFGALTTETEPVSRTVTVTNHGDTAATVNLETTLRDPLGEPADDRLTIQPATLTVPAGGMAKASVAFTPTEVDDGGYWGTVRAVDAATGSEVLRLAVGVYQPPPSHTLRLVAKPPAGWPSGRMIDFAAWTLLRVDAPQDPIFVGRGVGEVPTSEVYLPDGVYSAAVSFYHFVPSTGEFALTELVDPEIVVSGADHEVVVDGSKAVPVQVRTPRPAEITDVNQGLVRGTTYGGAYDLAWWQGDNAFGQTTVQVTPTREVTVGTANIVTGISAVEDQADLRMLGEGAPALSAAWVSQYFQKPKLDLNRRVGVVDAGSGTEEEVAGVRGRLALVTLPWREAGYINHPPAAVTPVLARLHEAGALGVLVAIDEGVAGWCGPVLVDGVDTCAEALPLPVLRIGPGEADALRAHLADRSSAQAHLRARTTTTYEYHLRFEEPTVSDGVYRVRGRQLHEVRTDSRAEEPRDVRRFSASIGLDGSFRGTLSWRGAPAVTSTYVGPVSEDVLIWTQEGWTPTADRDSQTWLDNAVNESSLDAYPTAGRSTQVWGQPQGLGAFRARPAVMAGPLANVLPFVEGCLFCRDGDGHLMVMPSAINGDGGQHGDSYLWAAVAGSDVEVHLYRDGTELPAQLNVRWDLSQSPEPADYRLEYRVKPYGDAPAEIDTTWWFRSEQATSNESLRGFECFGQSDQNPDTRKCRVERALQLSWDLAAALTPENTGVANGTARFTLHVYRQHGAPQGPSADAAVQVSYDGGKSWQSAMIERKADGEFAVRITHKPGATVSLRAQAWDGDGNRVEQTLREVYRVSSDR